MSFVGSSLNQPITGLSRTGAIQPINSSAAIVAAANSTATFTFPYVALSQTWTVTLNCAQAPDTAYFTAYTGASNFGSFQGSNLWGPFQLGGGDQLIVTAIGLIPGQTYQMQLIGSAVTGGEPGVLTPTAYADSVTVSTEDIYLGTYTGTSFTNTVTTQSAWRSFWVAVIWGTGATQNITVTGNQSGVSYQAFNPPYFANQNDQFYRYPVINGLDTTITLTVSSSASFTLYYGADLADIDTAIYADGTEGVWVSNPLNETNGVVTSTDPLYVVPYGGLSSYYNSALPTGINQLLTPPTGYAYRLHSIHKSTTWGMGLGLRFGLNGYSTVSGYGSFSSVISNGVYLTQALQVGTNVFAIWNNTSTGTNNMQFINLTALTAITINPPGGTYTSTVFTGQFLQAPNGNIYIATSSAAAGGGGSSTSMGWTVYNPTTGAVISNNYIAGATQTSLVNFGIAVDNSGNVWNSLTTWSGSATSQCGLWVNNTQINSYAAHIGLGSQLPAYMKSVIYNPTNNCIYHAPDGGNIYVYNATTQALVATISTGATYYLNLALNPAGTVLYGLVGQTGSSIYVINTTTNTLTTTITGMSSPGYGIAPVFNSAGTSMYVASGNSSAIYVINTTTNTLTTTITTSVVANPYWLAIDSTGTFLYCKSNSSGSVNVITLSTNTVTYTPATTNVSNGLALNGYNIFTFGEATTTGVFEASPTLTGSIGNEFASLLDGGSATAPIYATDMQLNGRLLPPGQPLYVNNTSSATAIVEVGYDKVRYPLIPAN